MLSTKAQEVLKQLMEHEKENVKKMGVFEKNQFLTEKFGSNSEQAGISFGLFPLWVKEVLSELEK